MTYLRRQEVLVLGDVEGIWARIAKQVLVVHELARAGHWTALASWRGDELRQQEGVLVGTLDLDALL